MDSANQNAIETDQELDQKLQAFLFKPFSEMTNSDYDYVGFKSGLEIHQQVYTERKLFCRCPAGRYSDVFHAEILRHMRPTLSELGEYDGTALMEFKTKKEIIYHINRETVCTYEMDDTPPFELNDEALDIALEIGLLYGMSLVDEIHIARKQYLDGSIPTGFQRTTIVGVNGNIPYKDREIPIVQLGLEEDACREFSDVGHRRVYLTDRLGMPLIETVTAPSMKTPIEVAEVCDILRRMVRSTGKVRTGIGAARQDVNVSVQGGTRIEIKGVPRIPNIPLLTYNEAMRQWNLLRLRAELHRRGVTPENFKSRIEDVTKILRKTRFQPVRDAIGLGKTVRCVNLVGFKGLLRWQTQTDTYFSREISDRIRVIACMTVLPNILHSDSPNDTLSSAEWAAVKKASGATENDTVVLVWGDLVDVETATKEIIIRAREATIGIPSETRQALSDGTNGFERILPGADRMYPDTDLPPKRITTERRERIQKGLPEYYWIRERKYREHKIPEDCVQPLALSKYAPLFDKLVDEWKLNPTTVAVALIQFPKRIRRKRISISAITPEVIEQIFFAYKNGRIAKEGIYEAMERTAISGQFCIEALPPICTAGEFDTVVKVAAVEVTHKPIPQFDQKFRTAMRMVMKKVRGRVEGKLVASRLNSALQEKQA